MRRGAAGWVVMALAASGCSYESEWRVRPLDATLGVADAPRDTSPDAEVAADVPAAPDVPGEASTLDVETDVPGDLDAPTLMDVPDEDVPETLAVEAGADALADVACADACPAGESCFAGACRLQRSCAATDADAGCGMLTIPGTPDTPGGGFTMGGATPERGGRLLPGVRVSGFSMDTHEVTVARFRVFWNGGAPELPARQIVYPNGAVIPTIGWTLTPPTATTAASACNWSDAPGPREGHPINCVDPKMAQAFCYWDAGGDGGGGRLPTSAEWEYAALGRGPLATPRPYPWGTAMPSGACAERALRFAHFGACPGEDSAATLRVSRFDEINGLWNLMGNVSEWVADVRGASDYDALCWWQANPTDPFCVEAAAPADGRVRVARGGSFQDATLDGPRILAATEGGSEAIGFRCVRSPGAPRGMPNSTGLTACPAGRARCGVCIDPLGDDSNCGGCGNRCRAGTGCVAGRCVEVQQSCAAAGVPGCGMTRIEGGAVDLLRHVQRDGSVAAEGLPSVSVSDFVIDVHEVTVGRFREFVRDGLPTPTGMVVSYPGGRSVDLQTVTMPISRASTPAHPYCNWTSTPDGREGHPINCVPWATAQAFCVWDGANRGRLPTFAEWNHAARGTQRIGLTVGRTWPWGEQVLTGEGIDEVCARARVGGDLSASGYDGHVNPCDTRSTGGPLFPGGALPAGTGLVGQAVADRLYRPYGGLYDLIGNVFEWTADAQFASGAGATLRTCWESVDGGVMVDPLCRSATAVDPGQFHVRGGAFNINGNSFLDQARLQVRLVVPAGVNGDAGIGFRCVRSPPPPP